MAGHKSPCIVQQHTEAGLSALYDYSEEVEVGIHLPQVLWLAAIPQTPNQSSVRITSD